MTEFRAKALKVARTKIDVERERGKKNKVLCSCENANGRVIQFFHRPR